MLDTALLSRWGFADPDGTRRHLRDIGVLTESQLEQIARVADPDAAVACLSDLAMATGAEALATQLTDDVVRARLFAVLGSSVALGDHLARHPERLADLRAGVMPESARRPEDFASAMGEAADADALRIVYRGELLGIAARDLTGLTDFETTAAELADLAAATVQRALELATAEVDRSETCRLAVIGMGKTGGRELNYISDVDVIYVYEPVEGSDVDVAARAATKIASMMMRLCAEHTAEGAIWEVDANLRPEGASGPLVRRLSAHLQYYERWASTWEFQALLKARVIAGDAELGQDYLAGVGQYVWSAASRDNFVADTRAMRRRVIDHIPDAQVERELKLGPGGLRDVEFAVQLLQLVHGRTDEALRSPTTLEALRALINRGYVGRADGAALAEAYEFLRTLENRIQLFRLRRTHLLPEDAAELRRLGRSMGYRSNPAAQLTTDWQAHRREVRRLHEKLFYRPLLSAVAALPGDELRLSTEAARDRLAALGYEDPRGALSHLQALTAGVSRRAAIQRSLLPAMLHWFAESPNPDGGLLAFRQLSDELGETPWFLRKLRDEGEGAQQLAQLLSSSQYVTDLMKRAPDSVAMLGDESELTVRTFEQIHPQMASTVKRRSDPAAAFSAIRRTRRRELARIAIADLLGRLDIVEVGEALTDLTTAYLDAALAAAIKGVERDRGEPLPTRMALVVMGRLGGFEAGYGSDADVMFVHDPLEGADEKAAGDAAMAVAVALRKALAAPGPDPALELDADLRPEGKNGPLVRTLASYRAYYERWSDTWEAQALLRATASVGDQGVCAAFTQMIDPLRWPAGGLSEDGVREIRRIKARVDAERLPRGANPATHLKLGRGGIADVEWTVQLLQMQHAHAVEGLRTTKTLAALEAAVAADLIDSVEAAELGAAWRLVSRIRNAVVLMRSKPAESMVQRPSERAGVAHILGYGMDHGGQMVDEYLRTTRHARRVVEQIFWGDEAQAETGRPRRKPPGGSQVTAPSSPS